MGTENGVERQKIGVLTFHNAINYGAVLQTYALEKYIQNLKLDSEIINYRNECIYIEPSVNKRVLKSKGILSKLYHAMEYPFWLTRYKKFSQFLSKINVGEKCTDDYFSGYTKIIVGSDQVWNLEMTNYDYGYFLENAKQARKYSYAASFGEKTLPESENWRVADCLKGFETISVREMSGKEMIKNILPQKNVKCVLDPTFLLSREEWESISTASKITGKYVLIYQLAYSKSLISIAKKVARGLGCKLVTINGNIRQPIFGRNILDAGPNEWLGLFSGAEAVVTNSFHGTVFSIIFRKRFYTELLKIQSGRNDRVITLLKLLGLETRILHNGLFMEKDIDYEPVEIKLTALISYSKEYLDEVLEI